MNSSNRRGPTGGHEQRRRRMNRLKLIPQITSRDCMKFNVANGIGGRLDYAV
jgi:hypothetical protein